MPLVRGETAGNDSDGKSEAGVSNILDVESTVMTTINVDNIPAAKLRYRVFYRYPTLIYD